MALYDYERQQYQQPRKPVSNDELFRQMQAQAFGNQNTSQPVEESSGLRRFVGDPLVSLGRGVIGAGEGFVGLANIPTAGYAGKALTDLTGLDLAEEKRNLAKLYTPEQQQAFQEVEAAEGFLPTLKSMVQRPSTIAHSVIESVPSMVGGGLVGKGLLKAAPGIATSLGSSAGMLAGAAGEGAMTAGQIAETARQQSDDGLINFKQAGQAVAGGIGTGALGVVGNALGGKLANKLGVDITDIDTALVTGKLASSGNIGKRLIAGGISEGVFEELPQSVQEQLWTNAATGRDLYEGVQEAAATGLLTGAAMGGGANVFSSQNMDDTKKEEIKPPREQLLNVDKQIFDLEQNTQTPESQQTLNTLYGQRDELLKNIRGITDTPVTKYEQPLSDDIDTISRQITNLEASGRDTVGTKELLQDLYGQKEILAKQIEDAPWIETEREIERQQRVRDYPNKIKSIESDETLNEEDKTNQINLLTQQYQQDYKPRDFASEARKTMQKSVEKLTSGTFIPADQNELDMAMDDLMAQYEELAREEEDIKKSEEIINNQKRVLGLSKQVDGLKEIQPLKDRAKVENTFNALMIKENQTGLTDQEKKTLTTAKAKLTKDNNRIEKIAKLNQEMSQLFTDTDETLIGRFQRDFDIQRQESQEQQDYKNTLYDKAINFLENQDQISPQKLMRQFDLTPEETQEILKKFYTKKEDDYWKSEEDAMLQQRAKLAQRPYDKAIGPETQELMQRRLNQASISAEPTESQIEAETALKGFESRQETRLGGRGEILNLPKPEKRSSGIVLTDEYGKTRPKTYDPFDKLTQRLGGKVFPRPKDLSTEAVEDYTLFRLSPSMNENIQILNKMKKELNKGSFIAWVNSYGKPVKGKFLGEVDSKGLNLWVLTEDGNTQKIHMKQLMGETNKIEPFLTEREVQENNKIQNILSNRKDNLNKIVQDVPEMSNEKSTFTDEQPVEQIVNQQQEQPVEQTINTEQPTITKPVESVEDFQTIEDPLVAVQEDIQARQDNISALKASLEENAYEQSKLDDNDPEKADLKKIAKEINEQIKEANRELLITRLTEGKGKFQITYHGTPHQWQPELGFPNGRPRLDKIGTGEGAAAFGHGWYSADSADVAKLYFQRDYNYEDSLLKLYNQAERSNNYEALEVLEQAMSHMTISELEDQFMSADYDKKFQLKAKQTINQIKKLSQKSGALYKLDIPDETIPKLLEWEKPISEQSEYVKSALKKLVSDKAFISSLRQDRGSRPDFITGVMGISDEQFQNKYIAKGYSFKNGDMYNRKGEKLPKTAVEQQRMLDEGSQVYRDMGHMYRDLAHMLGSDVAASNALLNVGIPGNKYFDGMSRADGKGSYNYVIWDQNVLDKIALLERNGKKIKAIQKQYETRNKQEPTKGISLSDIKKNFKTEEVSQDENGIISVKFKNGKGITFNSIQDAGNGFIQFAINTGQLSKNGKILGVTTGSNVLLDKDFADNKTVWHETFHVFKNLNMINDAEYSNLVKDFNNLRKAGKLQFSLSTHEDPMAALEENLANSFAQVMTSREDYRNTALGKMIQRIMDFMKKIFSFGQQSLSGFAKEVETGKIYDREISDLKTGTATPNFQSIGNTNSEEFKTWFGKSAAKTKAGEPVVFYHGTPNNFTVFENRPGQSTLHATSGLGHFFTMDKNYAEAYSKETGNVMSVYLKMEKPYKMSLEEAQSYETVLDAKVAQRLLKRKGYDSVIIPIPGSQPMITIFNSNQIKSIHNQGTWDINNPDIRFEVREKLGIPEQDIPQAEYDKMRQENRDLIGKTKQFLRSKGHEVNREMNKYLGVTSTNLAKIHPMLRAKVRRLDFDTLQRIHSNLNIALPVLEAVKKMSSNERSDFDWAVKNGDSGKILSLTGKYNFTEQYNALRAMLDQTHEDLKDVGYKPGFVDTYWPRLMKDREGFLQATREISRDPVFTQALQDKASKLGKTIEQLDPDVRADIIAQKIMEIKSGMGGPANIQGRIFDKIPIDLGKYYMDSSAALVQYIYSTAKNIEARKFFGKVPTKISNAKSIVRQNNDKLNKLQNTAGLLASQDRDTTDIDLQIKEVKDNIKLHEKVIEEYGQTRDFTDNIGSYIDEIRASQLIPEKKFQENEGILKDILSARFHERGTSGIANIYKNVSLLDTMGSPLSAFTQIQDLGWSIYVGGLTPRGITNTVKNIGKAIAKRSDITKEDLGLEWIAQEFADADTLSSIVNKTFKLIGLNYVDSIGKESLINNAYDNYRVKAKDKPKLFKEIRHMFNSDKETNQVIEDLQNNVRDSKDVQFLTFSRLLDFQPAAKSEMPEKMLTAGNWRLAYLLKTFTIKQFDVFRNEVWHKLKSGDKGQVIEGLRNMAYLTSIMTLAGAGADELKDFILGKETRFEDHVIENFLTLGGANRYIRMQVNREGIGTALGKQVLPPFKFIDNIYKDISQDVTDLHSARFVDSIPVVGKLYYWHLGRGAENKESIAEQDFKKLGKDVREFKKRLENNTDKRAFVQANISEYRQMKRHENVQGNLNKYTSLINKLKKVPQTENVKRRINQLEERKEQIMTRYFM